MRIPVPVADPAAPSGVTGPHVLALTVVVLAALVVGYALGRVRPLAALDRRTWLRITFGEGTWGDVLAYTVLHPLAAWRIWRRREAGEAQEPVVLTLAEPPRPRTGSTPPSPPRGSEAPIDRA